MHTSDGADRRPGILFVLAAVRRANPKWPAWRVIAGAKERYDRLQRERSEDLPAGSTA